MILQKTKAAKPAAKQNVAANKQTAKPNKPEAWNAVLTQLQELVASRHLTVQVNRSDEAIHQIRVVDSKNNVIIKGSLPLDASRKAYKPSYVESAKKIFQKLSASKQPVGLNSDAEGPTAIDPKHLDALEQIAAEHQFTIDDVAETTEHSDDFGEVAVISVTFQGADTSDDWDEWSKTNPRAEDDWSDPPADPEADIPELDREVKEYCRSNGLDCESTSRGRYLTVTITPELFL